MSRHEKDRTWSELTWFETTVLNYFICTKDFNAQTFTSLKFSWFLSLFTAVIVHTWIRIMKGTRFVLIYFCYQTGSIYSAFLGISILQLLIIYCIYDYVICLCCHRNNINTGSRLPNISDTKTRKRWNMIRIDMIRFRVYCLNCFLLVLWSWQFVFIYCWL
jgi:hypothetical protein